MLRLARTGLIWFAAATLWMQVGYAQTFNMLGAGSVSPVAAGGGSFSLTYGLAGSSSSTASATVSFGSLTWGSGCTSIILPTMWYENAAGSTVSGASSNAIAASAISGAAIPWLGANLVSGDVWQVTSPSGTSGNVTFVYSAAPSFTSSAAAYCLISAHPTPGTAVQNHVFGGTSLAVSATIPSGGSALIIFADQGGAAPSITNATVDATVTGGTQQVYAHATAVGTGASVTFTATFTSDSAVMEVIPFGP